MCGLIFFNKYYKWSVKKTYWTDFVQIFFFYFSALFLISSIYETICWGGGGGADLKPICYELSFRGDRNSIQSAPGHSRLTN